MSSAMVAFSTTAVGAAVKGSNVGTVVRRVGLKEGARIGRLVGELHKGLQKGWLNELREAWK